MMNFWIFKVKDGKIDSKRMKGIEIYRQDMLDALWGLSKDVRNGRNLSKGDYVVFYLAGRDGNSFLGTAILDSHLREFEKQEKEKRRAHGPFFSGNYGVKLKAIEIWETAKPIHLVINDFGFITNKKNWGSHLQGSIRAISESDYKIIASLHEEDEIIAESDEEKINLIAKPSFDDVRRKARDEPFKRNVRKSYHFSCAVCEKNRFDSSGNPEVESAHIYPKELNGSDNLKNGIALCKLHHWAFEKGLFSIRDNFTIVVEERIKKDENYKEIFCFENKKIKIPKENRYVPHPIFLKEHRKLHGFE